MHAPAKEEDAHKREFVGHVATARGLKNLGFLFLLCLGILALFVGYPITTYVTRQQLSRQGGFNLGGLNASGQVPDIPGNWGLIDDDTPKDAYTMKSKYDPSKTMRLVFSDEFNTDGRTFYPGEDPYWEAVDLHYWGTNNLEWYDPAAVTTKDGYLVITLSRKENHNLDYTGGTNKFCYTGGYLESSVILPGSSNILGLWPALWTMGNLGRAGYGASLDGMWPYAYDECDVGTAPNQTNSQGEPHLATVDGDTGKGGSLSYLPGQRLSRCTCPGEDHPGPKHDDDTFVGRAAPEIDVFEAQINEKTLIAQVSQSGQFAPFNYAYRWDNSTGLMIIEDTTVSQMNTFQGSVQQMATSIVTNTDPNCYELMTGCASIYGMEYRPGFDDGYITWIADDKHAWTLNGGAIGPDERVDIGRRAVPQEPMYILANLGMSRNFGPVDFEHLTFPAQMKLDYIRVYQDEDAINVGCDPEDFPTKAYINKYIEAYSNPNLTTWEDDYKQTWPKNRFIEGGC
ncbi:glycoside hydrolase family 16 protein [Cylindrobasidium torrendii FP15055 ss-10]|uniref:Glycoside hydrolase family 16 protein n=1 Tax=Cylindrobasidium torrendii FP15055 ss-10 TaxID=1314674 RepID=A0A0D7BGD8_9AGAR|nr:glycoside hydrolase family 16 protein [Cylindrobasidium torrendii FP15055 ss-10]